MKTLLQGYIDLHLHCGPSVAPREVDAASMALEDAYDYGYRAFVAKDHLFPTMMSAQLVEKHLAKNGLRVFGGIALNNSVGLFNLKAVDTACEMGAKFVCFPTIATRNHMEHHKGKGRFPGSGKAEVVEAPITYLDGKGRLLPEAEAIIEYVARHPELILATGHGTLAEVDAVVQTAAAKGVKKIYVNHPYYLIDAPLAKMEEWTRLGAVIECNASLLVPESTIFAVPFTVVEEMMARLPLESLVIVSDLGQKGNMRPALGVLRLMEMMMKNLGVTEAQLDSMGKKIPAALLDLDC